MPARRPKKRLFYLIPRTRSAKGVLTNVLVYFTIIKKRCQLLLIGVYQNISASEKILTHPNASNFFTFSGLCDKIDVN